MEQDIDMREIRKIREYVDLGGKDVLEVGCGDGRVSSMLVSHVKSLTAIDPDSERLAIARSKVPGADFRQGVGENLPFPDGSFDIVAYTFSLHHHQDSARALAEAHRVLKPSGQALVIEPSVEGEMHRFFRTFRLEDQQIANALKAIGSSGFSCEKSETFDILWTFDDAEDVYRYFFQHNKMEWDESYVQKMKVLLGSKAENNPIRLAETVNIFSLIKI